MQNGQLIEDRETNAEKFYDFFIHRGSYLADKIPKVNDMPEQYLKGSYMQSFFTSPTNKQKVITIEKLLKNKSAGHDDIGVQTVKSVIEQIAKPLTHIRNISGIFPNDSQSYSNLQEGGSIKVWKLSTSFNITHILKSSRNISI